MILQRDWKEGASCWERGHPCPPAREARSLSFAITHELNERAGSLARSRELAGKDARAPSKAFNI
ncbi:MAG: hypothetical protein M3407_05410 [Acidobacteriota bacterium]|nr:hypothetical protein [Acidobacteriota bacterium]